MNCAVYRLLTHVTCRCSTCYLCYLRRWWRVGGGRPVEPRGPRTASRPGTLPSIPSLFTFHFTRARALCTLLPQSSGQVALHRLPVLGTQVLVMGCIARVRLANNLQTMGIDGLNTILVYLPLSIHSLNSICWVFKKLLFQAISFRICK